MPISYICNQLNGVVFKLFALVSIWLGCLPTAIAEELPTPENEPGVTTVEAHQVIEMIHSAPGLILIDSRIASARNKGYIEGAMHLPDLETNCQTLATVIPSKDSPAIFYCGSYTCGRSLNAVRIAKACGYSQLFWFRQGFDVWREQGFPYVKGSER